MPLCLAAGVLCGLFLPSAVPLPLLEHGESFFLGSMMVLSGILLGSGREAADAFRRCRPSILLLPLATALGSLLGGLLCSAAFGYPAALSLAASGGLCWYTLSGALTSGALGASAGATAFLCGLIREAAALALIPALRKKQDAWCAASMAGATSGDVCLPAILRSYGGEAAAAAVINGVACTALVPVLTPVLLLA